MKLKLAGNLTLPADDLVESAVGIIGKRGKGKTGLVKVLAEELVRVGLPFVWLDPIGIAWGLRSSFDGTGPGLPVLIVGGLHGDVRLDRRGGAQVAKAIIQANVSAVIDFSQEPKTAYREFVRDFAHELFRSNDTSRLVIVEEASELVPQMIRPGAGEAFEAVERLVSRGRNNAIGVVLVSQRAATINKDVLSEVDVMFVFGLVSPQDRKAMKDWTQAHGAEEKLAEFNEGLAQLAKREAWAWSPEAFGGFFKKIYVDDFHTFHPDKTHLRKLGLLAVKPVTTDVSPIVSKLGTEMERLQKDKADAAEVPRIRAEVAKLRQNKEQLEKSLQDLRSKLASRPASATELKRAIEEATRTLRAELAETRAQLKRSTAAIVRVRGIAKTLGDVVDTAALGEDVLKMEKAAARPVVPPPPTRKSYAIQHGEDVAFQVREGELVQAQPIKSGAIRILRELASRHPMTLTRSQLGTLTGFTPSGGTFQIYYSQLKRLGYFEEDLQGGVHVTPAGLEAAGEIPSAPSTHEDVMARWKQSLKRGAGEMLQAVVDAGPEGLTKQALAESTQFTESGGTFQTYLSILRRNGLVEVRGDQVIATELLFP